MKNFSISSHLAVVVGVFSLLGGAALAEATSPAAPAVSADVGALAWMVGDWRREEAGRSSEEFWVSPAGGLMLGLGRTIKDDRAVSFEYLRIEQREATVVYVASPEGGTSTDFGLRELGERRVIFENTAHDFPQRVLYWRDGEDLCARIEGEIQGESRHMEWCWSQVGAKGAK